MHASCYHGLRIMSLQIRVKKKELFQLSCLCSTSKVRPACRICTSSHTLIVTTCFVTRCVPASPELMGRCTNQTAGRGWGLLGDLGVPRLPQTTGGFDDDLVSRQEPSRGTYLAGWLVPPTLRVQPVRLLLLPSPTPARILSIATSAAHRHGAPQLPRPACGHRGCLALAGSRLCKHQLQRRPSASPVRAYGRPPQGLSAMVRDASQAGFPLRRHRC